MRELFGSRQGQFHPQVLRWSERRPGLWTQARLVRLGGAMGALMGTMLGCSGDTTGLAPYNSSQLYYTLQLNQYAVNLALTAPYDTFRITATPLNPAGGALPRIASVVYTASDSTVTVDSTGLITARYVTNNPQNTQVIAALTMQGITDTDTVIVHVTATPPAAALATISLQNQIVVDTLYPANPTPSTVIDTTFILAIHATDATGDTVSFAPSSPSALVASVTLSQPNVAEYATSCGCITRLQTGHTTFYITTWAYGIVKRDSLPYVVGYPNQFDEGTLQLYVSPRLSNTSKTPIYFISPPIDTIEIGQRIRFDNPYLVPVDIVFDDSLAIEDTLGMPGGNIHSQLFTGKDTTVLDTVPGTDSTYFTTYIRDAVAYRTFPKAGTFPYRAPSIGARGVIVVSTGPSN